MYCPNRHCPDLEATGRPGEYLPGVTQCPHCGAELVALMPEELESPAEPPIDPDLEPVFETADPAEAEVIRSILTGAEIPFLIQGQDQLEAYRAGHAAFRFHPLGGAIRFVVPLDRSLEARILLTEQEENEP